MRNGPPRTTELGQVKAANVYPAIAGYLLTTNRDVDLAPVALNSTQYWAQFWARSIVAHFHPSQSVVTIRNLIDTSSTKA
jgi:hypothetical protein